MLTAAAGYRQDHCPHVIMGITYITVIRWWLISHGPIYMLTFIEGNMEGIKAEAGLHRLLFVIAAMKGIRIIIMITVMKIMATQITMGMRIRDMVTDMEMEMDMATITDMETIKDTEMAKAIRITVKKPKEYKIIKAALGPPL